MREDLELLEPLEHVEVRVLKRYGERGGGLAGGGQGIGCICACGEAEVGDGLGGRLGCTRWGDGWGAGKRMDRWKRE